MVSRTLLLANKHNEMVIVSALVLFVSIISHDEAKPKVNVLFYCFHVSLVFIL